MNNDDVLIKWIGSKRIQSEHILKHFPSEINTYYEPFLGGGSMLYALMCSKIQVHRFEASDLNRDLIEVWKRVKAHPEDLSDSYAKLWEQLSREGKDFYYRTRREFNKDRDPDKFFFLLRTCRNGLVRYNQKGEFNPSFHLKRQGMKPQTMRRIIQEWYRRLNQCNVTFTCRDYREIVSQKGDLVYLDPPYATPKDFPIYFGMIDYEALWEWLRKQQGDYLVSLNGRKGHTDCTIPVPSDVFNEHLLIPNGLSKMDQLVNNRIRAWDSLYLKGDKKQVFY
jgi:DNA adenine methylase